MKCDKAIETYLKLDNNQSLPLTLQIHLLRCSDCKKFISIYQNIILHARENKQIKVDFKDEIMHKIQMLNLPESQVSNFKWILAGLLIIAGFVCIPFSKYSQTLISYFGANLELPLSIVMGCAITVYSAIFVMTHTSIFNSKVIERFLGK